jgi:hypothetical protein
MASTETSDAAAARIVKSDLARRTVMYVPLCRLCALVCVGPLRGLDDGGARPERVEQAIADGEACREPALCIGHHKEPAFAFRMKDKLGAEAVPRAVVTDPGDAVAGSGGKPVGPAIKAVGIGEVPRLHAFNLCFSDRICLPPRWFAPLFQLHQHETSTCPQRFVIRSPAGAHADLIQLSHDGNPAFLS